MARLTVPIGRRVAWNVVMETRRYDESVQSVVEQCLVFLARQR